MQNEIIKNITKSYNCIGDEMEERNEKQLPKSYEINGLTFRIERSYSKTQNDIIQNLFNLFIEKQQEEE